VRPDEGRVVVQPLNLEVMYKNPDKNKNSFAILSKEYIRSHRE
jgi:hypothetical protein